MVRYKFNTCCQILPRTIVEFDSSSKVVQKMGKIEEVSKMTMVSVKNDNGYVKNDTLTILILYLLKLYLPKLRLGRVFGLFCFVSCC